MGPRPAERRVLCTQLGAPGPPGRKPTEAWAPGAECMWSNTTPAQGAQSWPSAVSLLIPPMGPLSVLLARDRVWKAWVQLTLKERTSKECSDYGLKIREKMWLEDGSFYSQAIKFWMVNFTSS